MLAKIPLRRNIQSLLKKTFDFIHHNPDPEKYIKHPIFFSRERRLTFPIVATAILNLFKESVEYNISVLMQNFHLRPVSGAAFSLARYKINLCFFKDLNKILIHYHQHSTKKLWKEYQLIAGDGSTVALPSSPQMKEYFGIHSKAECGISNCLAQTFILYDVFSEMVIDSRISKMEVSEKSLLRCCLSELPNSKAIFILDRGFGHFNVCKRFIEQKRDFCIRMSGTNSTFGKTVMQQSSDDFIIEWKPSEKEKKTCSLHAQDSRPIKVRITKVRLKTGETEILVSSLYDMVVFSSSEMKDLYKLRWGVEEGFKKLKPKMKLEQFGSRKPEGVFQEFEAHIFIMNLVAILGCQAQSKIDVATKKRKLTYKFNWQNAFRYVRNRIVKLLYSEKADELIEFLITNIASSMVAVKPDRCFPRAEMRKNKSRAYQNYK